MCVCDLQIKIPPKFLLREESFSLHTMRNVILLFTVKEEEEKKKEREGGCSYVYRKR